MKKIIAVLSLFVTLGCAQEERQRGESVTIFYLELGIQTAAPVTRDTIEAQSSMSGGVAASDGRIQRLVDLFASGLRCDFDEDLVRAKLSFSRREAIYIDNYGCVVDGPATRMLDPGELAQAGRLLEDMTQRVQR